MPYSGAVCACAPAEVVVVGFSEAAMRQLARFLAGRMGGRPAKRNRYLTNSVLAELFGTHANTVSNWRTGRVAAPDGFASALQAGDYGALKRIADRYRDVREARDAYAVRRMAHGLSEEAVHRHRLG